MSDPQMEENESQPLNINVDENIEGTQHLTEPVGTDDELGKLKAEIDDLNDRLLRKAAEFDNFRRRTAKERLELIQTAGRSVMESLLDVLDDSDRAKAQLEKTENIEQVKEGVNLVFNKLSNVLAGKGLKAMETTGQDFNPDLHEAISEMDAGAENQGKVVAEVSKGYYLNDTIIRHAKVVVGK